MSNNNPQEIRSVVHGFEELKPDLRIFVSILLLNVIDDHAYMVGYLDQTKDVILRIPKLRFIRLVHYWFRMSKEQGSPLVVVEKAYELPISQRFGSQRTFHVEEFDFESPLKKPVDTPELNDYPNFS